MRARQGLWDFSPSVAAEALRAWAQRMEIPVADPDATGPVALDLVLPAWLEDAVQATGVLEIGPGHPWYNAALAAVQNGALVR